MTPLCKIEVTLPRVQGSRGCIVAVLSMSKQEFSRLNWTADPDAIIEKVRRGKHALESIQ
jgi:hypothetical protein